MNSADKKELANSVLNSKGVIRIFIHPYYSELSEQAPTSIEPKKDHKQQYELMQKGLEVLLKTELEKAPPLFIFEEEEKVQKTISKIEPMSGKRNYIVPTNPRVPSPRIPDVVFNTLKKNRGGWEYFIELMKSVGVRKVLIAGRNFNLTEYENGVDFAGNSCIGKAVDALENNFEIDLSLLSYPNTRNDLKK